MDTLTSTATAISALAGLATAVINLITSRRSQAGPQHSQGNDDNDAS